MSLSQLFLYSSLVVIPAWLLLLLAPAWRWTRLVAAYLMPSLIALLYLVLMLIHLDPRGGGFDSLDRIARMYQNPAFLLASWLHFLAFDLFVGAWEVRDAQRLGISHVLVAPCLVLTYLAGPIGLIAYYAVRAAVVRKWPGTEPIKPERLRQMGKPIIMPATQPRALGMPPPPPRDSHRKTPH